jgi:hypothetical protein
MQIGDVPNDIKKIILGYLQITSLLHSKEDDYMMCEDDDVYEEYIYEDEYSMQDEFMLTSESIHHMFGYFASEYFCEDREIFLVFPHVLFAYDPEIAIDKCIAIFKQTVPSLGLLTLTVKGIGKDYVPAGFIPDWLLKTTVNLLKYSVEQFFATTTRQYVIDEQSIFLQEWPMLKELYFATVNTPGLLESMMSNQYFPNLKSLKCHSVPIDRLTADFSSLTKLELSSASNISSEVVLSFVRSHTLKSLQVVDGYLDFSCVPLDLFNTSVTYLDLSDTHSFAGIARVTDIFSSLKELNCAGVADVDGASMIQLLKWGNSSIDNYNLKILDIDCIPIRSAFSSEDVISKIYNGLESFSCVMCQTPLQQLCNYIEASRNTIRSIDISAGSKNILDMIPRYQFWNTLTSLNLYDVGLKVTEEIAECFIGLPELRKLHLEDKIMSDISVTTLFSSTRIQCLSLNRSVGVNDSVFFSSQYLNNTTLTSLHISSTSITAKGLEQIIRTIGTHQIRTLDVTNNNLSGEFSSEIELWIKNNETVRVLVWDDDLKALLCLESSR